MQFTTLLCWTFDDLHKQPLKGGTHTWLRLVINIHIEVFLDLLTSKNATVINCWSTFDYDAFKYQLTTGN